MWDSLKCGKLGQNTFDILYGIKQTLCEKIVFMCLHYEDLKIWYTYLKYKVMFV